jgi:hypothetical protein
MEAHKTLSLYQLFASDAGNTGFSVAFSPDGYDEKYLMDITIANRTASRQRFRCQLSYQSPRSIPSHLRRYSIWYCRLH